MNSQLPDYNNFYSFFTGTSKQIIAHNLLQMGWTGRESKWGEWDLRNDWSELTLNSNGNGILLNGAAIFNLGNVQILNQIFDSLECGYQYEFYDEQKNVLLEKRRPT